jgi:hypothetical protein
MAVYLKLIHKADGGSAESLLDLYGYEDGLAVYDWTPGVPVSDEPVMESMGLRARGTSDDNFAAVLQALDQKRREANQYRTGVDTKGVWLYSGLKDETNTRQALVLGMHPAPGRTMHDRVFEQSHTLVDHRLAIERMPYWEDISDQQAFASANVAGGMTDYGTIGGDVPARIAANTIGGTTGGNGFSNVWLGFRTDRYGTRGNFVPVWYPGDAVTSDADTSLTAGGLSSTDFATNADLAERVVMTVANACSGNYPDQRGEFQVLLQASVNSGKSCNVRLSHGLWSTDITPVWTTNPNRVTIDNSNQIIHDLGVIRFPFVRGWSSTPFMRSHALRIEAQRVSDTCLLEMRRLFLVPRSEGMLHIRGGKVEGVNPAIVVRHPDDRLEANWYNSGAMERNLEVNPHNYALPVGAGAVVIVAQRHTTGLSPGDTVDLTMNYYQRWRTLKGAG